MLNIFVEFFKLPVIIANSISVTLGITTSYFLNHHIVFRHPEKHTIKNFIKFFAITGFSAIVIQDLIIDFIAPRVVRVQSGQLAHMFNLAIKAQTIELNVSKLIAVIIGLFWNFILYKHVVFTQDAKIIE